MVVTKHFATHGEKYRRRLIKYILNPDKTNNLKLVSDFGVSNYLDFPTYEETVEMYNTNFLNNDALYNFRNDRQEKRQQKIHAHHLIQSFSPDDNLSPEEVNRIGYETIQELTGGQFRFIVATHTDHSHLHNHIVINSVDINSYKKLKWDYAQERNFRMISDRISKIAGAKIIENRYSHRDNGIIFIPNYQLDTIEEEEFKKYKVYIRETTSYFVYNKESSYKDRYIKGRTLIRQLTQDSQKLPYRRPTVANIQQKISEINLLIELNTSDKSYHEIKEEFVTEIAKLDIRLHETQEKIAALDKMAEVFINLKSGNQESRKLAKYDFAKFNLSETLSLEKVNQDIFKLQKQLDNYLENYEDVARRLENFVEILNKEYTEASKFKYQESLDQPEI